MHSRMYVGDRLICCQVADRRFITWPFCDSRVPYFGYALSADHCPHAESELLAVLCSRPSGLAEYG